MLGKLSEWFSWQEAVLSQEASRRGLDNTPPLEIAETIQNVTAPKMDLVRVWLNHPILVSSWYRSRLVNAFVGGSSTSQHRLGLAVDFICPGFGTPYQIVAFLRAHMEELGIDQLIWEHTWVHISFTIPSVTPRHEVLTLHKSPAGEVSYSKGLPPNEPAIA